MTGILILSDLRRITGKSARAINYAIEKYGPAPIARIGIVRVWPKGAIPEIRESLRQDVGQLHSEREGQEGGGRQMMTYEQQRAAETLLNGIEICGGMSVRSRPKQSPARRPMNSSGPAKHGGTPR